MRRKEKEITKISEIEGIIRQSIVCRIGLSDNNVPYIVPMSFGYQDNAIYIHGSLKGKKIDILQKNKAVCFEFDVNTQIVKSEDVCNWSVKYQSVIGNGNAVFLETFDEKKNALGIIMNQYADGPFQFSQKAVNATAVIKIDIIKMTGKQSGF